MAHYFLPATSWLSLVSLMLAACSSASPAVAATPSSIIIPTTPAQPADPVTPSVTASAPVTNLEATPSAVLAHSVIEKGPFAFHVYVYNDPSLGKEPVAPSLYSDLSGVGAYTFWKYQGPGLQGPVEEYWGTLPQLTLIETFPQLLTGQTGGRSGGILLPGGFFIHGQSHAGDPVEVVIEMRTPGGVYRATISFILAGSDGNFSPIRIQIQ